MIDREHYVLKEDYDAVVHCLSKLIEALPYPEDDWWGEVDEETINVLENLGLIEAP